jgi:hypothetical protein
MTYDKPEIVILGQAVEGIRNSVLKQNHNYADNDPSKAECTIPAYEGDE